MTDATAATVAGERLIAPATAIRRVRPGLVRVAAQGDALEMGDHGGHISRRARSASACGSLMTNALSVNSISGHCFASASK